MAAWSIWHPKAILRCYLVPGLLSLVAKQQMFPANLRIVFLFRKKSRLSFARNRKEKNHLRVTWVNRFPFIRSSFRSHPTRNRRHRDAKWSRLWFRCLRLHHRFAVVGAGWLMSNLWRTLLWKTLLYKSCVVRCLQFRGRTHQTRYVTCCNSIQLLFEERIVVRVVDTI